MANYSVNNLLAATPALQAVSSTYKTEIEILAQTSGLKRFKIYDILVGTAGTPADNYMEFDVARATATCTGTASTPVAIDPADAACSAAAKINATAEGTVTATSSVWYIAFNQRASFRWIAAPGSELVAPATNNNGFVLRARSAAYTGNVGATILFSE